MEVKGPVPGLTLGVRFLMRGPKRVHTVRTPPNRLGIGRGTSKIVRTFNRSMIALLEKKLGHKENRSRKFLRPKIFDFFKKFRSQKFSFSYNFQ